MNDQDILDSIRKKHENAVVVLGTLVGLILLGYFFSYAQLTDRGSGSILWFQGISALLLFVLLFRLKWFAFFIVKFRLRNKSEYQSVIKSMTVNDI